jgi:hypothetical protein
MLVSIARYLGAPRGGNVKPLSIVERGDADALIRAAWDGGNQGTVDGGGLILCL